MCQQRHELPPAGAAGPRSSAPIGIIKTLRFLTPKAAVWADPLERQNGLKNTPDSLAQYGLFFGVLDRFGRLVVLFGSLALTLDTQARATSTSSPWWKSELGIDTIDPSYYTVVRDDPGMRLARAQRLTGRATELGRAEARSAVRGRGVPGGSHVRPTRTTEPGSRDDRPHTGATSLQTCLVFSAPRPRPSKSPGIHRKNSGPPPSDPGVRASAGLGGGGGSLERTCLARRQANKRRIFDGSLLCPALST